MEGLDDARRERLRLCAYCPNACRRGVPNDDPSAASEAATPSALAYLAIAVDAGWVEPSTDIRAALAYQDCVRAWAKNCQYDMNIAADLEAAMAMVSAAVKQAG